MSIATKLAEEFRLLAVRRMEEALDFMSKIVQANNSLIGDENLLQIYDDQKVSMFMLEDFKIPGLEENNDNDDRESSVEAVEASMPPEQGEQASEPIHRQTRFPELGQQRKKIQERQAQMFAKKQMKNVPKTHNEQRLGKRFVVQQQKRLERLGQVHNWLGTIDNVDELRRRLGLRKEDDNSSSDSEIFVGHQA